MRVVCFIDGFNMYHALARLGDEKYKWVDLRKLSEQFISEGEQLTDVYYFTAYCEWNKEKKTRHKLYVQALETKRVKTILGAFKVVTRKFSKQSMPIIKCSIPKWLRKFWLPKRIIFQTHEEKEMDVNIALKIVELAVSNQYDKAIIISGDSDLVPAITTVRRMYPTKKFKCVLPPNGRGKKMCQTCDEKSQISRHHLDQAIMDSIIITPSNITIASPYIK